ncbi:MAG: hypothetical protein WBK20_16070 [Spirochaetota bacterium]
MLNAIIGLDIFSEHDYEMFGIAVEAKGSFAKGFKIGNAATNGALYANIARTVLQKTGQKINREFFKEIIGNKEKFAAFMKGFVKATGQGVVPSVTKTKVNNNLEKVGYVMGIIVSERAKFFANEKINEYDKK